MTISELRTYQRHAFYTALRTSCLDRDAMLGRVAELRQAAEVGDYWTYRKLLPINMPRECMNCLFIDYAPQNWQPARWRFGDSWRFPTMTSE